MCYALTWWGAGYDVRENCYTVHGLGNGRDETRYHGGALDSVFTTLSVLDRAPGAGPAPFPPKRAPPRLGRPAAIC